MKRLAAGKSGRARRLTDDARVGKTRLGVFIGPSNYANRPIKCLSGLPRETREARADG